MSRPVGESMATCAPRFRTTRACLNRLSVPPHATWVYRLGCPISLRSNGLSASLGRRAISSWMRRRAPDTMSGTMNRKRMGDNATHGSALRRPAVSGVIAGVAQRGAMLGPMRWGRARIARAGLVGARGRLARLRPRVGREEPRVCQAALRRWRSCDGGRRFRDRQGQVHGGLRLRAGAAHLHLQHRDGGRCRGRVCGREEVLPALRRSRAQARPTREREEAAGRARGELPRVAARADADRIDAEGRTQDSPSDRCRAHAQRGARRADAGARHVYPGEQAPQEDPAPRSGRGVARSATPSG